MSSNLTNQSCSLPANLKSAEDWADDGFDWGVEDPRPFRDAQIQRYRQIQADALRWAYEQRASVQGYARIIELANQLDPKPEEKL